MTAIADDWAPRKCPRCLLIKPPERFGRRRRDGVMCTYCIPCREIIEYGPPKWKYARFESGSYGSGSRRCTNGRRPRNGNRPRS